LTNSRNSYLQWPTGKDVLQQLQSANYMYRQLHGNNDSKVIKVKGCLYYDFPSADGYIFRLYAALWRILFIFLLSKLQILWAIAAVVDVMVFLVITILCI